MGRDGEEGGDDGEGLGVKKTDLFAIEKKSQDCIFFNTANLISKINPLDLISRLNKKWNQLNLTTIPSFSK